MTKKSLKGLTLDELKTFAQSLGEPSFRGTQLFTWIYAKSAGSFEEMSDISREFRSLLEKKAALETLSPKDIQRSPADGTTKILFELADGKNIESVLIPPDTSFSEEKRLTLCVSTQVGCPLRCAFCATGTMGLTRNLTAGEIVDQVLQAQKIAGRRITNVVFMGMGEPLLNYEQVMKAVDILNDDRSVNIGGSHLTISTAGYPDKIRRLADERRPVKLALSLHSLDDTVRSSLMPLNKTHNIPALLDAVRYYAKVTRRRPTFEYILFDGVNDTDADAERLVKLAKTIPCKVNLIPFHSIDSVHPTGMAASLRPSSPAATERFARKLRNANLTVMVRRSAGEDIDAACGQLAVRERSLSRKKSRTNQPSHHIPEHA